jgi:hypothetical protein
MRRTCVKTTSDHRAQPGEHVQDDTDQLSLTPLTLTSIAQLCKLVGHTLNWKLGGSLRIIAWDLGPLHGLLWRLTSLSRSATLEPGGRRARHGRGEKHERWRHR